MLAAVGRVLVVGGLVAGGYALGGSASSAAGGAAFGALVLALEAVAARSRARALLSGVFGSTIGLFAAALTTAALGPGLFAESPFARLALVVGLGWIGFAMGVKNASSFSLATLRADVDAKPETEIRKSTPKLLDTSVIIDGRIAEIAEAGFIEGPLVIPQFVLVELQQVADSSDPLKRNRGRRGLDMLQRIQKNTVVPIEIVDQDVPELREVDLKLIELALRTGAKIVTNDFNLNKVAQLRGVKILNINDLANCLRPIVLPGEPMRIFVSKEGKEHGQGVGYLDDGTMVVVEGGRRALGRTIDVNVTTVLQTAAGKMIFVRWPEAPADDLLRKDTRPMRRDSGRISVETPASGRDTDEIPAALRRTAEILPTAASGNHRGE